MNEAPLSKVRKTGRGFGVNKKGLLEEINTLLQEDKKKEIEEAVEKTVREYSETLKLLGRE